MTHLEAVDTSPCRADAWHAGNAHCRVHYQLLAEAEPDLLCRALNLFALQGLTPQQVQVQRHDDLLAIDVVIDGLSWHRAQVIAQKLRNLISVCSVDLQAADCAWAEAVLAAG
jgi:acetolactate synthase small subunit